MKTYLIDPETKTITPQNYDGRPDSLYSLFGSLLVDTHDILNEHMLYSATEAYERGERGYFVGEKLLFGKALLSGISGFEDTDVRMTEEEIKTLTLFDLPAFYEQTLQLLPKNFSFEETYELSAEGMKEGVTPEWVIYVYNMADAATKSYFLNHLEAAVLQRNDLHEYMKKMGEIAVNSMR